MHLLQTMINATIINLYHNTLLPSKHSIVTIAAGMNKIPFLSEDPSIDMAFEVISM